jgi:hypothetical protein
VHTRSRWLGVFVICSLGACGSTPAAKPPLHYAAVPTAFEHATFVPEADLFSLTLPCAPAELPDNGLDDDCDGHVDAREQSVNRSVEPKASLRIAVTEPGAGSTELTLSPEPQTCTQAALAETTAPNGPWAVRRLELGTLSCSRYGVVLKRLPSAGQAAEISVAVAVETPDGTRTYLTRLAPEQQRRLGHIEAR